MSNDPFSAPEDLLAARLSAGMARASALKLKRSRQRKAITAAVATGLTACLAAVVVLPRMAPAPVIYETAHGEHRDVTLADGTALSLNTGTRIAVSLSAHHRNLTLDHGEVALNVVHDAARPFQITAGSDTITDIGTQFNVRRDNGAVTVGVSEGSVGVTHAGGNVILTAGQGSQHHEAAPGITRTVVDASELYAWKSGHAVYHDRPLTEVAADLNRYFDRPIRVEGAAANLRLTAALTLDSEQAVTQRLSDYLPVRVTQTAEAVVISAK